jgi:hypothetical protein
MTFLFLLDVRPGSMPARAWHLVAQIQCAVRLLIHICGTASQVAKLLDCKYAGAVVVCQCC